MSEKLGGKTPETDIAALAMVTPMRFYRITGEQSYIDKAAYYADIVMGCQQLERRTDRAISLRGFFYESRQKACILAYYHSRLFNDKELKDITTRQMEYIVGYNPFAMSIIYGDGYDYPPLYGAFSGNVVGAVPVGIETFENDDEPYMPMQSNATYKEIWIHTTALMIWLMAELFHQ